MGRNHVPTWIGTAYRHGPEPRTDMRRNTQAGVTESAQRTYDSTARKLNRFLQNNVDALSTDTPAAQRRHGGDRTTHQTQKDGRRRGGA